MSTSYHPESDGQTEVLNRVLEQYLRAFVHSKPKDWSKFLSLAEWSYNTSTHSASGFSPYQIIYGKPPPSIPTYLLGSSSIEVVDDLLSSRQAVLEALTRKLTKAQASMKLYADKKRRDLNFSIGDWVYVKLRPYRQVSIQDSSYTKLSKRFYGPYQVLEKIGQVAYKLDLPATSKIHPVFHCSLLKLHKGPPISTVNELPPTAKDNNPIIEPLAILDSKMDSSSSPPSKMVLVQWFGLPPEDASWEKWDVLASAYHLEDKVTLQGGDIDNIGSTDDGTTRPKRKITKPIHLREYILTLESNDANNPALNSHTDLHNGA